jgi:hypothetical protein
LFKLKDSDSKTWMLISFIQMIVLMAFTSMLTGPGVRIESTSARETSVSTRRANVPYAVVGSPNTPYPLRSIFWFGQVGRTSNYADVRIRYDDQILMIAVHVIDRLLWYEPSPSASELTNWDAVSIYLDLDGNTTDAPGTNAYQLISQVNAWQADENWQAGFRGTGTGWAASPIPFTAYTTWRGNGLNNNTDDKGWIVKFTIPFASLDLSEKPSAGTEWGLAVAVHDRDDASGTIIPDTNWPESMDPSKPSTWGELVFGVPGYNRPPAIASGVATIRQGLDGAFVEDAHVGGHGNCGADTNYWQDWGDTNYAGYSQINIQNQWDIADWPCFSKYYVTFPLETLPRDKTIISAKLTMHLFGNAGGGQWGEPPDSYIQVLTVGEDWDEATVTWNNAPLATENITGSWVHPRDSDLPDQMYQWDVSRAVAEAYAAGEPLRLALYSADGERHTGKYFWSSDVGDWNASARPALHVIWGLACDSPDVECNFIYLPLIQ